MPINDSTAVLAVADVNQTVAWYQEVLGFSDPWFWGEPPGVGGIRWGGGQVMFIRDPALASQVEGHQHYFFADEVDVLFELHVSRGAAVIAELSEKPWGVFEYTLRDPNGYHLRFGGSLKTSSEYENRGASHDIRLERRLPDLDDYVAVRKEVGWGEIDPGDAAEILERCLYSVVAIHGEELVGMALATGDGRQQIYVQDVAVRPGWQKQGIGTLIVDDLLEHIQETAPPGCWVSLFCAPIRSRFYGRLGFRKGHGLVMQVGQRD